jgi:hypothetical protein
MFLDSKAAGSDASNIYAIFTGLFFLSTLEQIPEPSTDFVVAKQVAAIANTVNRSPPGFCLTRNWRFPVVVVNGWSE